MCCKCVTVIHAGGQDKEETEGVSLIPKIITAFHIIYMITLSIISHTWPGLGVEWMGGALAV